MSITFSCRFSGSKQLLGRSAVTPCSSYAIHLHPADQIYQTTVFKRALRASEEGESKMLKRISGVLSKFWLSIFLVVLVVFAGATDKLSVTVQTVVRKLLDDFGTKLLPLTPLIFLAVIGLNGAYALWEPASNFCMLMLDRKKSSPQNKLIARRILQVIWWGSAIFGSFMLVFGDTFWKIVMSFGALSIALGASWQPQLAGFLAGLWVQFTDHVQAGELVMEIGGKTLNNLGKVTAVDSGVTRVEEAEEKDGQLFVWEWSMPNQKIAVEVVKRLKSVTPVSEIPSLGEDWRGLDEIRRWFPGRKSEIAEDKPDSLPKSPPDSLPKSEPASSAGEDLPVDPIP